MERARGPMRTVEQFAQGIVDVANAVMEKAIRVISVERGHDQRDYTLVAFGGAGGLHACDLAASLRIPRVLIPRLPGGLSALGILRAHVVHDYSRTVRMNVASVPVTRRALASEFRKLEARGRAVLRAEGFAGTRIRGDRLLDMRYVGQAYELTVAESGDFLAAFHKAHERRYGYSDAARAVEVVNVRARLIGVTDQPQLDRPRQSVRGGDAAIVETRRALFGGRAYQTRVYDRAQLAPGQKFTGPAIVSEYSATTVVPPEWRGVVDSWGNLVLTQVGR
jgi:N-methylhydantoinase A